MCWMTIMHGFLLHVVLLLKNVLQRILQLKSFLENAKLQNMLHQNRFYFCITYEPMSHNCTCTCTSTTICIVGLVSTFLNVHPTGASVEYIASYLSQLDLKLRASDIEDVLELCPSVFKQQVFGIGASLEKRWKFVAYDRNI